jgi:lipopolysaccharide transport system ATP-binding protein
MSDAIITVENLGKKYRIAHQAERQRYVTLRDVLAQKLKAPFQFLRREKRVDGSQARSPLSALPSSRASREDFWALKDVSFEVKQGETLGIIGRNGAGKSTLLKILSRITEPTTGRVCIKGRVASLLEVGTGFHPELTGRENIFLNGAILGMTRAEIKAKFDEIVAFSEVEKFLDTPVKRYSNGMYVRLAFAVAAHLEMEILIVDEVLAVGDAAFQKKCLGKMGEVAKSGRTVLFVSHNTATILQLCEHGIQLVSGRVDFVGSAEGAVAHYMDAVSNSSARADFGSPATVRSEMPRPRFLSCELLDSGDRPKNTFCIGDAMKLRIRLYFPKRLCGCFVSFIIKSVAKGPVFHAVTRDADFLPQDLEGEEEFCALFASLRLYPGTYVIDDLWLANGAMEPLEVHADVLAFTVLQGGGFVKRPLVAQKGIIHEIPVWTRKTTENRREPY